MSGNKKIHLTYKQFKKFVARRFVHFFHKNKSFLILFVIWLLILCIILTDRNAWSKFFTYPENTYSQLEAEAERMITNKDWETNYEYRINDYNSSTHYLKMVLLSNRVDVDVYVTVTVDDYSKDTPNISYERHEKSKIERVAYYILIIFLLIPAALTTVSYISFLFVIVVILFFVFIIRKVFSLDKKEEVVDMQEDQQNEDL